MTTEQQRKMLECTAKACGINIYGWAEGKAYIRADGDEFEWNPLTNPADCAEMCAKLEISTLYFKGEKKISCGFLTGDEPTRAHIEPYGVSRLKAWMYAATLVAAKIGNLK